MNSVSTFLSSSVEAPRSDTEAVRRTVEGDSDAFEHLYFTYKTRVYSVCVRIIGNPAAAEDLVQETFMLAFRHLASFRGECKFSTWLFRIATNTALMKLRRAKARIQEVSFNDLEQGHLDRRHVGKLESELGGNNCTCDRIRLEQAIAKLPPRYKTMVILHYVDGYEHSEIAQMMGCSVSSTKSRLHRARARLRRDLGRPAARTTPNAECVFCRGADVVFRTRPHCDW